MGDPNMFADRAKGVNRKVKMERFKRKKVYLISGTKLQKWLETKACKEERWALERKRDFFPLGKKDEHFSERRARKLRDPEKAWKRKCLEI